MAGGASLAPPRLTQHSRLCSAGAQRCIKYLPTPPDHHSTSATPDHSTEVIMALPKATIVTGRLEGLGPRVEVEGGGLCALGLVLCASCRSTTAHCSTYECVGALCAAGLAADWPS